MIKKNSYKYEELIDCANGKLFGPGNAKLPSPPMLMFNRITKISQNEGKYKKGFIAFDYHGFGKVKKPKEIHISPWLTSFGFIYNGLVFSPGWFVNNKASFKKNPDRASLRLIEGDYYIHSGFGVCCFLGYEEGVSIQDRLCFSFSSTTTFPEMVSKYWYFNILSL